MAETPGQKAAKRNWDKANMTVMACKVKRADAPKYHQAAANAGTTVNAVLRAALDELLDKYGDKTP